MAEVSAPTDLPPVPGVAGILLTGGASRRMGTAKAGLRIEGQLAAQRLADRLSRVTRPALEAGPGWSDLPSVLEPAPGAGPLHGLAAAAAALAAGHRAGPAMVVACDLPLLGEALLRLVASWPAPPATSVVPVVEGRPQPLCARLSGEALVTAAALVRAGHRSMRSLLAAIPVSWMGEDVWGQAASVREFADTDRPGDLDALGLTWSPR